MTKYLTLFAAMMMFVACAGTHTTEKDNDVLPDNDIDDVSDGILADDDTLSDTDELLPESTDTATDTTSDDATNNDDDAILSDEESDANINDAITSDGDALLSDEQSDELIDTEISDVDTVPTPCETENEIRFLACGFNGDGTQKQKCVSLTWQNDGDCDDPDECKNDDTRDYACGYNDNGLIPQICTTGAWINNGICIDPDECKIDAEETCPYTGPAGTENIGACKAGKKVCEQDGSGWTSCSGEVNPVDEICGDTIDQDCDSTADNLDFDKDGFTECGGLDCCSTIEQCPDPAKVYPGAPEIPNGLDDNCNDEIDEGIYDCDSGLSEASSNAMDYAKAMGLCATTTEGGTEWGVISAQFLMPDGTGTPHAQSHGLFTAFGNVITPKKGEAMAMLTTGFAADPFDSSKFNGKQQTTSTAPGDWLTLNGNVFPAAPACGGAGTAGSVNDPVMLKLRIRTPEAAKSFYFNLYFFSQEYIKYVCSDYNDFFLTLLDSGYEFPLDSPEWANPTDKNLAVDSNDNPVSVNLAPNAMFKQCANGTSDAGTVITTCENTTELAGTGFETYGGSGWLTIRGNVVGGEIIDLRFVIWDTGPLGTPDYIYNSTVLIDNFQWMYEEYVPGADFYN